MLPMLDFVVLLIYKTSKEGVDETKKLQFIWSSRKVDKRSIFHPLCCYDKYRKESTAKQKRWMEHTKILRSYTKVSFPTNRSLGVLDF